VLSLFGVLGGRLLNGPPAALCTYVAGVNLFRVLNLLGDASVRPKWVAIEQKTEDPAPGSPCFHCCWITGQVALFSIAAHVGRKYCFSGPRQRGASSTLTYWALLSLYFVTANFPYWWRMLVPGVACLNSNPRQNPWGCCVSAALGSCLDLIRRSCNANDKLLKPVRGDSVSRFSEGPCTETVLGYAASVVWNVMRSS
jgi:hypothetical protein